MLGFALSGEFVAAYATDLSFFAPLSWYIPTDDLVSIFARTGTLVRAADLPPAAVRLTPWTAVVRLNLPGLRSALLFLWLDQWLSSTSANLLHHG